MKAGTAAIAVVTVLLLVACSSGGDALEDLSTPPTDPTEPTTAQLEIPVMLSLSASSFEDGTEEQFAARRTWTPPTGYKLYSELYEDESYVLPPDLSQSTIDLFMTHDAAEGEATTAVNPLHARLRYSPATPPSTSEWKLSLPNVTLPGPPERKLTEDDVTAGNYYAYGFVPRDAADDAEITKLRPDDEECTWSEGAVLTILGLKSIATDPCVIIGAKEGPNDHETNGLRAGDFKFKLDTGKRTIKVNGEDKEVIKENYLYFLFDHLYSAFSISMRVDGTYHKIRHIKLKKIYLRTETADGTSPSKTNVTITLQSNGIGNNPIVGDVKYEPNDDTPTDRLIYNNSVGYSLTDEYSMFLGHFMPNSVSKLILTSVYDVYDTDITPEKPDGNLIRKDCSATNTMLLSELFSGQTVSHRGWKYKVRLTINPTFLYMMSEPDLDNPTVTVE